MKMEFPKRFGTAVHKKGSRCWMHLPASIADTFKKEGIAVYEQEKGLLVGYSEQRHTRLAERLRDAIDYDDIFWMDDFLRRDDAYELLMNNATEHVPIKGRQKIWLPKKLAPERPCAAVVSIVDNERFSIEYLL